MVLSKIVSSLEKCFLDESIDKFSPLTAISVLKNERLSLQLLHTLSDEGEKRYIRCAVRLSGTLAPYTSVRAVDSLPVIYATDVDDGNYLRTAPGLYPDLLRPLHYDGSVVVSKQWLQSAWIEIDLSACPVAAGEHTLTLELWDGETLEATHTVAVDVIDAVLPENDMRVTQWFHCDSLVDHYGCEAWSERHWEIIENFARTAVRNGINLLLTPIHTPPLDTAVGGERTTTQLVDVTVTDGEYSFGFEKLDRWIDMCDRVGVKYLEIAHFFTQWGAHHAPKIMATVDGEYKRIFGWDTDATGEEYARYLRAFIPAFLSHMKARGDDKRCYFHVSDEPCDEHLESYRAAKATVAPLLEGYPIMDALSNFDYWKNGLVDIPIPASNHIEPFLEAKVPGLWTYYCCSQQKNVSNRFLAMPLCRTRCIGMQFYKYDIAGFLQWGFNFYRNCNSGDLVNPYVDLSGDFWVPAGDTCSVYPAQDGTALESMRIIAFYEGLQDLRAMRLAGALCGKDTVVAELERVFGGEIRFDHCVKDSATMLALREAVNALIKSAIKK